MRGRDDSSDSADCAWAVGTQNSDSKAAMQKTITYECLNILKLELTLRGHLQGVCIDNEIIQLSLQFVG